MKPTTAAQIQKEENRKKRHAAENFRRWIEEQRRRQMQAERDRRRKWLIFLLLMLLDTKPAQMFFPSFNPTPVPPPPSAAQPKRRRRSDETGERPSFNHEEHIYFDYSTRPEERHLHVMDGLTYEDIIELNRTYRPYLFKTPAPIPGMPARYADARPHIWSLLDHLSSPYHRKDAITALKVLVSPETHDWIDTCSALDDGWKELKRCRMKTPEMTVREFPRAAARWREVQRREAEARKKEAKETPDNGPKPPCTD